MTDYPPLWLPQEEAYTPELPLAGGGVAETRFGHGLELLDERPRIIPGDHGQPPGRRRDPEPRTIHNVRVKGGLL